MQWRYDGGAIGATAPGGTFLGAAFSAIGVLKTLWSVITTINAFQCFSPDGERCIQPREI